MSRESEATAVGRQTLIDGVRPISHKDSLTVMAAQPMTPKQSPTAIQKPCNHGLFDEVSCAQLDLCDLIPIKETDR